MMQQAEDLLEEGLETKGLLDSLSSDDWQRQTPFKNWTVTQVIQHLHGTDKMAVLSLTDADAFIEAKSNPGGGSRAPVPAGSELLEAWWTYFNEMCQLLGDSDPKRRVPWFGPDMGVMMFTTARQMETWAHTQDIYDLLKRPRNNTDRLKNIAVIGVKTYGWTFANRQVEPPGPAPYVKLSSPSGETWEFNDQTPDNRVEGAAVDFCRVVTQGRNIADVDLTIVGDAAEKWMAIAQCFAGPPQDPPAPGSRSSD